MQDYESAALGLQAAGMLAGQFNNVAANIENKKLLRENYRWNEKMFDRQMAYNWDMWNKTNEYNSPYEISQRLLAAGINPALVMEKEGVSSAQNFGSPSPGSVSPPTMQPYDSSSAASRISDMIYNMSLREKELQMADANIEKQEMENRFNSGYYEVQLRRARHQAMRDYTMGLITMQEYQDMKNTIDDRMSLIHEDVRLKRGQADYQESVIAAQVLENKLKEFKLEHAPDEFKAQMALLGAEMQAAIASGKASIAQASKAYAERAESIARTSGVQLSNSQARATFFSTVMATNSKNWADAAGNRNEFQHNLDTWDFRYASKTLRYGEQVGDYLSSPVKGILRIGGK